MRRSERVFARVAETEDVNFPVANTAVHANNGEMKACIRGSSREMIQYIKY